MSETEKNSNDAPQSPGLTANDTIGPDATEYANPSAGADEKAKETLDSAIAEEAKRWLQIAELSGDWVKNLVRQIEADTELSIVAIYKTVLLRLAVVPVFVIFYLSLVLSCAYIAGKESNSIYVGIATLISLQVVTLLVLHFKATRLKTFIGYSSTKRQILEMKDVIRAAIK